MPPTKKQKPVYNFPLSLSHLKFSQADETLTPPLPLQEPTLRLELLLLYTPVVNFFNLFRLHQRLTSRALTALKAHLLIPVTIPAVLILIILAEEVASINTAQTTPIAPPVTNNTRPNYDQSLFGVFHPA